MKFKHFPAIFFALISICMISSSVYASNDDDWRLILYQHLSKKINDTHKISLYIEESRYNQMKQWGYIMPDIEWKFKTPLKYMPAASLSYRHVYYRINDEWSRDEKRYNINLFFTSPKIGKYTLTNRLRFEYRDKKAWNNWRIRNEVTFSFPYKWTKYNIQPHIIDEFRYSLQTDKLTINELGLILTASFVKNSTVRLGYRWAMINNEPKWLQYHIIMLGLSVMI